MSTSSLSTDNTLRIGARHRLTAETFDMYDSTENYSARREICEDEEFVVLRLCRATINGKPIGYLIYKVIIRSGDVGYVGYPIVDACVEIA